jgi:hypothetical protein
LASFALITLACSYFFMVAGLILTEQHLCCHC